MTPLVRRVAAWFRRGRIEEELESEIAAHLDFATAENLERGMSEGEARRRAVLSFGGALQMKEDYRRRAGLSVLDGVTRDVRYAVRSFRRSPGLALAISFTMAVAIGANTVVFGSVRTALLGTLPLPASERVVAVWFTPAERPEQKTGTNPLGYFTIREANDVFENVGAVRLTAAFNVIADSIESGPRTRVPAQWLTFGIIPVLGVDPAIGRWPQPKEQGVTVISHGLWQRLFGGTPEILGRKLRFDAFVATVIGVMPQGFELVSPADFWLFQTDDELRSNLRSTTRIFSVFGRLKPGVTLEQARADMSRINVAITAQMPDINTGWSTNPETLRDVYVGDVARPLLVLQGAVLFVLLIACANVAALLLTQGSARHGELALRVALGASRWQIVRQLLTESGLLALVGGALGLASARVGSRLIVHAGWQRWPSAAPIDGTVLIVTMLVSLGCAIAFGLVPALSISRPDRMIVLRESTRNVSDGPGRITLRAAFVIGEVSLALVLVVGAALMINSLLRVSAVAVGFDTARLMTFQVPFPRSFYTWDGNTSYQVELGPKIDRVSEDIRQRLSSIPGVRSVGLTVTPPLGGDPPRIRFSRESGLLSSEREAWSAEWYPVGSAYFRTLNIPFHAGRDFGPEDSELGRPVAIVSSALAETFWPGEQAIGRRIQLGLPRDPPREIIGVVGDVRQNRYQRAPVPQLYVPRWQLPRRMDMTLSQQVMLMNTFVIRLVDDGALSLAALQAAVAAVDASQVVTNVKTVDEYAGAQLIERRAYATMMSLFGAVSFLLALVGVYGVLAHLVSQRRREIGIRMALGAQPAAVVALVVRHGMWLVAVAMAVGTAASLMLTRVIHSLLWGITPTDPLTFAVVDAAFVLIGMIACLLPARRASRIDPLIVINDA